MDIKLELTKAALAPMHCMSKGVTRSNLCGMYIHRHDSGKTRLFATDGSSAALVELLEEFGTLDVDAKPIFVEAESIKALAKLLKGDTRALIEISVSELTGDRFGMATVGDTKLTLKLGDEDMPQHRHIYTGFEAEPFAGTVRFDAKLMRRCMGVVIQFGSRVRKEADDPFDVTFFGELRPARIYTENPGVGTCEIAIMPMRK